jgi:hypothetical protein
VTFAHPLSTNLLLNEESYLKTQAKEKGDAAGGGYRRRGQLGPRSATNPSVNCLHDATFSISSCEQCWATGAMLWSFIEDIG